MNQRLRRIYQYYHFYLLESDYDLVRNTYPLDEALELPVFAKTQWLETLYLSVKSRHKTLECLLRIPNRLITDYF